MDDSKVEQLKATIEVGDFVTADLIFVCITVAMSLSVDVSFDGRSVSVGEVWCICV